MTHILVAGIVDDNAEVSVQHASMLLKLQQALARLPDAKVAFEFFPSRDAALTFFAADQSLEMITVVDASMSVNVEFLLTPPPYDFVAAAYPLRGIDWDRVKKVYSSADVREDLDKVGLTYNFVLGETTPSLCSQGTYLPIQSAQLKLFKLTRQGLNALINANPSMIDDKGHIAVFSNARDDMVCAAWPGPLYVDLSAKCVNCGPYDFSGCVGFRSKLR